MKKLTKCVALTVILDIWDFKNMLLGSLAFLVKELHLLLNPLMHSLRLLR